MTTRAKILEEIQNVPDELLGELYQVIKDFEEKKEPKKNVLARLREIRISATPDFSIKASL